MQHRALITAMYPLHDEESLKRLSTRWYYSKEQPIGEWTTAPLAVLFSVWPVGWRNVEMCLPRLGCSLGSGTLLAAAGCTG